MILGDMALQGEMAELSGFAFLQSGNVESAKGYFDSAATYYYLVGLPNAGRLCEWAVNNLEALVSFAKTGTLNFPDEILRHREPT